MKMHFFFTIIVFGLTLLSAQAQVTGPITTVPEGSSTFVIPATGVGVNSTCYFSAPLVTDPIYTGAVSAISFVSVTGYTFPSGTMNTLAVGDAPPPWTTSLPTASAPYFVKFLSGAEAGRVVQVLSNTNNTLTVDIYDNTAQPVSLNSTNFTVEPADTFEVFAGNTLGGMFGLNTTAKPLLLHGGTVITGDSVSIFSPAQNRLLSYFFNTTAGFWVQIGDASGANANNTIIRPYTGFLVTRRANEPQVSIALTGRVAEVNHLVKTTGGNATVYDSTGYPVDVTLAQLQLGTNWTKGGPITADTVSIFDAASLRFDSYYQSTTGAWYKLGGDSTDESTTVIPAATTVCFTKRTGVSGNSSYLVPVLPYPLAN